MSPAKISASMREPKPQLERTVPTMVTGVYGMNFEHMPELKQWWGYPSVMLVIAGGCLGLYRWFRKSGWL